MERCNESRTVLVTGASSGMGKAFAELLAVNGYRVFGTSRGANYKEILNQLSNSMNKQLFAKKSKSLME